MRVFTVTEESKILDVYVCEDGEIHYTHPIEVFGTQHVAEYALERMRQMNEEASFVLKEMNISDEAWNRIRYMPRPSGSLQWESKA